MGLWGCFRIADRDLHDDQHQLQEVVLHKMTPVWLGQMERILETLNQGVVLIDDHDAMIFGNRVFELMLGLDIGEWKQKSPRELYDNAALQFLEEKRQSSRDADQFEFFLPRPNSAPIDRKSVV